MSVNNRFALIFVWSLVALGCGPSFNPMNSLSQDARFKPTTPLSSTAGGGTDYFSSMRAVLNAHCASCHGSWMSFSEAQWLTSGLVVAGDPGASALVTRLRGYGGNMPQGGPIDPGEEGRIAAWVESLSTGGGNGGGNNGGGPNYSEDARVILLANCASCHGVAKTATSPNWAGATVPAFGTALGDTATMNAYMKANGLVSIAQDYRTSWLYLSLRGHGVAGWPAGTMPKTPNTALNASALEAIRNWIGSM
jgi:mono/diheme cytochrome c family protein